MTLNIANNTPSGSIANPDYWTPPFSLEGCVYAGLYHLDDLTKDLSGNGVTVTQVGDTVRDGVFPRFHSGNFKLTTDLIIPAADSISTVCLYKKDTAVTGDVVNGRGYLWSARDGAHNGFSLAMEGAATNPGFVAASRSTADTPTTSTQARGAITSASSGWAITGSDAYFAADGTTATLTMRDLLAGTSVNGTAAGKTAWDPQTSGIAIGGNPVNQPTTTTQVTIAAVLIYNRVLAAYEYTDILAYFRQYMLNRGIVI